MSRLDLRTKRAKDAFENGFIKAARKIYAGAQKVGRDTIKREVIRVKQNRRRKTNQFGLYINPNKMTDF